MMKSRASDNQYRGIEQWETGMLVNAKKLDQKSKGLAMSRKALILLN
jgi:hypothetical protein